MNQISWLIYFANVSGNLGGLLVFLGILAAAFGVGCFIMGCCTIETLTRWDDNESKLLAIKLANKQKGRTWPFGFLAAILWVLAAFTPGQNTVMAIAASQAGEQLLNSKTGNLAQQALNAWLQRQITPDPAPKSE